MNRYRPTACSVIAVLLSQCAFPAIAFAADAEEAPPSIVVTGQGLEDTPATPAYNVQTIERERITSSASGRIEDVLASAAGFQQFRRSDSRSANPSAQGVTLRALGGNATSRSLVLLDGVPMADPFFGYIPLSAIDPGQIGAVRVTRGGGAGAFGLGAVAGTIELTSAHADTLGLLNGAVLADDRGETELSATLAPKLGQGFAVITGRWDRGQGFWTTPEAQRVPASVRARYDSWSTGARLVTPLSADIELQARALVFDDHRTLRFAGADSSSGGGDGSLRLVGRGPWQFDVLGYVQKRNFSNIVISSTSFKKTLDQRDTPSTGWGGKLELRPPLGDAHVLRLGVDYRASSGEAQEDAYNASGLITAQRALGGRNSDLGLFIADDWTLGALVLTGSARADRWSITGGHFRQANPAGTITTDALYPDRSGWNGSYRGGAVLTLGGGVALRAAAYSSIRLPTLNELYRSFVVFPVTTQANPALTAEKLRGYEAGIDYAPSPALKLSLTAFDNKVRDAIANVTIAANTQQRMNVAAIRARGIELGAAWRLGQFSFDGSLAYTDSKVEASGIAAALDGKRPAQTPKISASGMLAWHPREGWQFAATLRHVGAQFEDDQSTFTLSPATTLGAYAEVPLAGPFSLVLRGENLTGETIVTRNQAGSIDLGAPRTVWAGVKLKLGR